MIPTLTGLCALAGPVAMRASNNPDRPHQNLRIVSSPSIALILRLSSFTPRASATCHKVQNSVGPMPRAAWSKPLECIGGAWSRVGRASGTGAGSHMDRHPTSTTIDRDEVARFSRLADQWWDTRGPMAALHKFNPVRLGYIRDRAAAHFGHDTARIDCL